MGDLAFDGCTGLCELNIGSGIKSVSLLGYYNTSLRTINIDPSNPVLSSVNGVVFSKDKTELIEYPDGRNDYYTIPNHVTKIGERAFAYSDVYTVIVPETVTHIGNNAFTCIHYYNESKYSKPSLTVFFKSIVPPALHYSLYETRYVKGEIMLQIPSGAREAYLANSSWAGYVLWGKDIITKSVNLLETTPTALNMEGICKDASVVECGFDGVGAGKKMWITGLEPNKENTVKFYVVRNDGYRETTSYEFKTSALELTTLKPRCVSSSCAVLSANTNIADEETGGGFQWKKYGAPESLEPNEGYAAVYGGQMEGSVKNLQSTFYYNVRAFYKSSAGTYYYGDWVTFDPSDFSYFDPIVHTYPARSITHNSASVRGYAMEGTNEIMESGFQYWSSDMSAAKIIKAGAMSKEPETAENVSTVFATGQIMTAELTELMPNTSYTCRAFVKTAAGIKYGEEQTFMTEMDVTGIDEAEVQIAPSIVGYYDLNGRESSGLRSGINIIKYSDGSVRKVMVK